jgi:hypothetical protein
MPKNIVVATPVENRNKLKTAINEARNAAKKSSDVWCVIGINNCHVLTIWSEARPLQPVSGVVRPTNHAEEILVTSYQGKFDDALEMVRRSVYNKIEIFLKYSPCNDGVGSCYEMFKYFLLKKVDLHDVYVIYDRTYQAPKSVEAIKDFHKRRDNVRIYWMGRFSKYNLDDGLPTTGETGEPEIDDI